MRDVILLLAVLFPLGACNTLNSVVKDKQAGGGTTEVYEIDMDQGWDIAKKAFRWGGSDVIEEYEDEGYMLTSSGMNLVSSGAVMGAWLEPMGDNKVKVTVVTKRRIATDIATTLTESKYHKYFAKGVQIIKSGKKLPFEAPQVN